MKNPIFGLTFVSFLSILVLSSCSSDIGGGGGPGGKKSSATASGMITSSTNTNNPIAKQIASCDQQESYLQLLCTIEELKKQLSATQLSELQREYSLEEAKKWSNFPQQLVKSDSKRIGLQLSALSDEQIAAVKAVVQSASSKTQNEGWDEIEQILNADEYLLANGAGDMYGIGNYYIAFLGIPSTTGTWELQFGGHHLAFANTYNDGKLMGATPSFRSSEPFNAFMWNGVSNQPIVQEKDAFSALLESFTPEQFSQAKLSETFGDLVAGPQKDGNFPSTAVGLQASMLSDEQKKLLLTAINTYVGDVVGGEEILKKYENELSNTFIAYSGNTSLVEKNDYIRIDGPSVWIEYSSQGGIVFSETHPHSVWRDKKLDYGGNK